MPNKLAESVTALSPRIIGQEDTDPWFLAWELVVGASYSLARATEFLPHQSGDRAVQTRALIEALARGERVDEASVPTWLLGYYLNSAEFRIQSAFHRLLRAYTDDQGSAPKLAEQILNEGGLPTQASSTLNGFLHAAPGFDAPGRSLRQIHDQVNSLKHDPGQDPSDHFGFARRVASATVAATELVALVEILGVKRGFVAEPLPNKRLEPSGVPKAQRPANAGGVATDKEQ